jgi:hypothetical protein
MGATALSPPRELITAIGTGRRFEAKGLDEDHNSKREGTNNQHKAVGMEEVGCRSFHRCYRYSPEPSDQ